MSHTALRDTADETARDQRVLDLGGPKWSARRTLLFVTGTSTLLWGLIGFTAWGAWQLF